MKKKSEKIFKIQVLLKYKWIEVGDYFGACSKYIAIVRAPNTLTSLASNCVKKGSHSESHE